MSDKDYGIEDLCESLDGIEAQLKRLFLLHKLAMRKFLSRSEFEAVEQI